jgi:flagellar hook-associated protein FlgK
MINQNTIQRLMSFVQNLEQKLSSVTTLNDKLQQLMTTVSRTHQTILEELSNVKTIINQITIEQEGKQLVNLDYYFEFLSICLKNNYKG